jgi:hypothetical protein
MFDYQGAGGGTGGDRAPIIKFSAKDGSFIAVDREQVDGMWQSKETELETPIKVVMDLAVLEMGWMAFKPAPHFVMVKAGEPRPERPDEMDAQGKPLYKWGFRVVLANKDIGLRELSSSSKNVYDRMVPIYKAFEAGKAANAGKVPVIEITGTDRVTQQLNDGSSQTWRVPRWELSGWIDRPEMLDTATQSTPDVPAPATAPPSAAAASDDIF